MFNRATDDRLGTFMANEQQENTSSKLAHKIAGVFLILSAYTIGLFECRLSHEVALLIILREHIQNTLRILLSRFAIPDKREFTSSDNTQRWHFYHRTPEFLHIRILEWSSTTNPRWQRRQLNRNIILILFGRW